jgi:hypothetical protein
MSCRKCCFLGLVLALLAVAPMFGGGSKKGTQYAILVAISKYGKTDQWRTLKNTIDEMDEFRTVLTKTGFSADNIVFLHDRQTEEKLRPTGVNILKKLDLLLQEIGPDDTLLVALNGHGVQFGGDLTGYFAPVNADLKDKKTLVAMDGKDGLYGRLEQCKARKKLLIVNACRNDPTVDPSFAVQKYDLVDKEDRDPPKGTAALFSCKSGQKSYEYPADQNRKRSFFYHHLIEAWQGKYADGEKVTLEHVFDQVTRKTAADARNLFSEAQTPWPRRKYEGEWLLAKAAPVRPDPNLISKEPTYFPLDVGNEWHFKATLGNNSSTVISRIANIERVGDLSLNRLEASTNGKVILNEHLSQTKEGIFRHRSNGEEISPPICLLKYPVKSGSRWRGEFTAGTDAGKYAAEATEEEVGVPAGKFKAVKVVLTAEIKSVNINTSYWFVKDLGIVKETVLVGELHTLLELEKSSLAKKENK